MRRIRNTIATGLAAAIALTCVNLQPVAAAPKAPEKAPDIRATQQAGTTEMSAQRRHYRQHRHYRYNRGNAAGAAAALGVFGAIAGAAAANSYRRDYYYGRPYGYYGAGPGYYYGPPRYYRGW